MSENELIEALESIMSAESDLRHEIERLNVIVRSHLLSNAKASGDEILQEKIVSSFSIGDFDSFEVEDTPLSKEELDKRRKKREDFDFTNGIEVEDKKLDFNNLVDRYYARKDISFDIGESVELSDKKLSDEDLAKKQAQRDSLDFNVNNATIEIKDQALSPKKLKDKESKRKKFNFRVIKNDLSELDDDTVEVEDIPLPKEELDKRKNNREKFDFNLDDSLEVEDQLISAEKLQEKLVKRSSFDFTSGVEVNDSKLTEEEINKREDNRNQIKESISGNDK